MWRNGSCDIFFWRYTGRLALAYLPLYDASCRSLNHGNNSEQKSLKWTTRKRGYTYETKLKPCDILQQFLNTSKAIFGWSGLIVIPLGKCNLCNLWHCDAGENGLFGIQILPGLIKLVHFIKIPLQVLSLGLYVGFLLRPALESKNSNLNTIVL